MIVYAAVRFGVERGPVVGPAFSAYDSLVALLASGRPVTVISENRCPMPLELDGQSLPAPRWIVLPDGSPLYPILDTSLPRRAIAWGRSACMDFVGRHRVSKLTPALMVVNDIYAHRRLERLRDWRCPQRVLILRASPSMMAGAYEGSPRQLERVTRELSAYGSVISVSRVVLEKWQQLGVLAGQRCFTIPNCAREEEAGRVASMDRGALRRRLGMGDEDFVAVCVASVQRRKGQDILLDNWTPIAAALPRLVLYLVGPVPEGRGGEEWILRIQQGAYHGRVRYVGARTNALEYIYAADVKVLPSRSEAMPLSVLEAMVLKTPVVAAAVDGIPELIRDGEEGRLFSPEEPHELVNGLAEMGASEKTRAAYAERAARRYWNEFSRCRQVKRYKQLVDELLR